MSTSTERKHRTTIGGQAWVLAQETAMDRDGAYGGIMVTVTLDDDGVWVVEQEYGNGDRFVEGRYPSLLPALEKFVRVVASVM